MAKAPGTGDIGSAVADAQVLSLFPSLVWVTDLKPEAAAHLNKSLEDKIRKLLEGKPNVAPGLPWQTDATLHKLPAFAELVTLIRSAARGALSMLTIDPVHAFDITACWANIYPQGARNSQHMHPNNFLSGTYYVKVPKGSADINFHDPRPAATLLMPPFDIKRTQHMGNVRVVPSAAGRLVLFPAWLEHSVPANAQEDERISVSFNIMFDRFVRDMTAPLWSGNVAVPEAE